MAAKAYHHGDLARALRHQARQVIETGGADALSLRGLARDLGVDPAAAYRHFKAKQDLLLSVAAEGFEELGQAMEAAMGAAPDAEARLVTVGSAYVRYATTHPQLFSLMFHLAGRLPGAFEGQVRTNPYEIFVTAVRAVLPNASEARVQAALSLLWSNVHGAAGLANQGLLFANPAQRDAEIEAMCTEVVALIARV